MESSYGQGGSRVFYNEIPFDDRELRLAFREVNVYASWIWNDQWSLNLRFQGRPRNRRRVDTYLLSRASIRWESSNHLFQLEGGRILNPFGLFFERTLPQDRTFITPPLFYSYYVNLAENLGFSLALQEPAQLILDQQRDWGLTQSYDLGYTTGIKGRWYFWADSAYLDLAVVNGALINIRQWSDPFHPTIIAKATIKPTYFWRQGISFAYGGFIQRDSINSSISDRELSDFRQLLIGTDVTLGYQYVEWSGELIYARYNVPHYSVEDQEFTLASDQSLLEFNMATLSGFVDTKVDIPFLIKSYVAYRFGFIHFLETDFPGNVRRNWDDDVFRHSVGFGYEITRFLLFQTTYAFQEVRNRDWALDHWKSTLTLHF